MVRSEKNVEKISPSLNIQFFSNSFLLLPFKGLTTNWYYWINYTSMTLNFFVQIKQCHVTIYFFFKKNLYIIPITLIFEYFFI